MYRYVCPHCLRTFVDEVYIDDGFCWECGEGLKVIPKTEVETFCSKCKIATAIIAPMCDWKQCECGFTLEKNGTIYEAKEKHEETN